MDTASPRAEYERRRSLADLAIAQEDRRHLWISNLRLVFVAAVAACAWFSLARPIIAPAWALMPVAAFLVLLAVHARVLNARDRAMRTREYYDRGFSRLDGSWIGSGADGSRFLEGHPYAADLDVFGPASLFQLLNTTRTDAGEEALADLLGGSASVDEIASRQTAVAELKDRQDFREAIAVLAAETPVSRTGALARWAASAPAGLHIAQAWIFALCAAATVSLAVAVWTVSLPTGVLVLWVAAQSGIAAIWRREVTQVLHAVDLAERDLSLLKELLALIERASFTSAHLVALHARLMTDHVPMSRRIARLRTFIAARDSLRNEFVRPFALLLLVRSQAAVAIDRWHAAYRVQLASWIAVVGEFEALASLATHAFEHPADPFPSVVEGAAVFDATLLGHPLMREESAVRNDVTLGRDVPHVLIVSGSNMSGKSTLLRTVGVNVVLAMAGAPVRAGTLRCSPLVIGATIHVLDSLRAGQSRFYAEILRIRDILDAARGRVPVLFLLDEILHGTNSHDRRIGAQAIVDALVKAGAIGLVTTHDLALTAATDTLGALARNVHFEDRLEEGRLIFDYRMRDGVVEHSNALALMRAVGLEV